MMQTIYIEKNIATHPRVQKILRHFPSAKEIILCDHYGEVFNPKNQNFRLQKAKPALILAEKQGNKILVTPPGFAIGGQYNYYFSHMLNCIYDCRYCFLQGMLPSANYVVFINYESFMQDITDTLTQHTEPVYFFSGYDGDSLAYEPVTEFIKEFLPFFSQHPQAILECRTKSTNIKALLNHPVIDNCIIAFSFTPAAISNEVEHKVPPVSKRIQAMQQLANAGWKIGLRFDPLIYIEDFSTHYQQLISDIFAAVKQQAIHSVTVGAMRFPIKMFQKIKNLYPQDALLAHPLYRQANSIAYLPDIEQTMKKTVVEYLHQYINQERIFLQ